MQFELFKLKNDFAIFQLFFLYPANTVKVLAITILSIRFSNWYLVNFYYDFAHKRFRCRWFFKFNTTNWIFAD